LEIVFFYNGKSLWLQRYYMDLGRVYTAVQKFLARREEPPFRVTGSLAHIDISMNYLSIILSTVWLSRGQTASAVLEGPSQNLSLWYPINEPAACSTKSLMSRTRESPDGFAHGIPECCHSTMLILMIVLMPELSRLLLSCTG